MTRPCQRLAARFGPYHQKGKQALEPADRPRVDLTLTCSVAFDAWGEQQWPRSSRWDYLIVTGADGTLAVEVHPATHGEVKRVIAKKRWALERLADGEVKPAQWWWIPSGKSTIPATGTGRRRLVAEKIRLARRVLDQSQVAEAKDQPRRRR
ncbi:hypothetical protein [Haliangium sp.]|uniref:hypothetical protein n=1 Tax=Haliangium sp. TaxID=2663208 RepID=UPI003D0E7EB8